MFGGGGGIWVASNLGARHFTFAFDVVFWVIESLSTNANVKSLAPGLDVVFGVIWSLCANANVKSLAPGLLAIFLLVLITKNFALTFLTPRVYNLTI